MAAHEPRDRAGAEATAKDHGRAGVEPVCQRVEEERMGQRARRQHHVARADAELGGVGAKAFEPRTVIAAIALGRAGRARGEADVERQVAVRLRRGFVAGGRAECGGDAREREALGKEHDVGLCGEPLVGRNDHCRAQGRERLADEGRAKPSRAPAPRGRRETAARKSSASAGPRGRCSAIPAPSGVRARYARQDVRPGLRACASSPDRCRRSAPPAPACARRAAQALR